MSRETRFEEKQEVLFDMDVLGKRAWALLSWGQVHPRHLFTDLSG